jgi:predicted nucleotidyltransferase
MSGSVQTKNTVLHLIEQRSQEIHAIGVRRLGLFGSFNRHEQNNESDVDLLVEFEAGRKNYAAFMRLANLLEETLGRPVDLLTLESLSPHIGPKILSEVEYVALAQ